MIKNGRKIETGITLVNTTIIDNFCTMVKIGTELGTFNGITYISPEDEKYKNENVGQKYALYRACIKYYKKNISILKHKIKAMEEYYNIISGMSGFDEKSNEAKKARRYIAELKSKIKYYNIKIEEKERLIKVDIEFREKYNKILGE